MTSSRLDRPPSVVGRFERARATTSQSADLGPCCLPRDLFFRGTTRCAARCRARALLLLPVLDGALVGALGLQRDLALCLTHRLIRAPDAAAALQPRSACSELEPAHLLLRERRLREGVVLAASQ